MTTSHPSAAVNKQLYIVLIHCHDLGRWNSVYGDNTAPTPNLQRFADSAVIFDNPIQRPPCALLLEEASALESHHTVTASKG